MSIKHNYGVLPLLLTTLVACGGKAPKDAKKDSNAKPFASTYVALPSKPTIIENVTLLTGTGQKIENAKLFVKNGKIEEVGTALSAAAQKEAVGNDKIDGTGKWITPGIIDMHSHLGVYAAPESWPTEDGNEASNPSTPDVWAEHSVWPQDPQFARALAGGVTTMLVLPGSANLFGGRGVVLKNIYARSVQQMKFPEAPYSLKMACGENPKRVYGEKGGAPSTRMGNFAGYRKAWIEATNYKNKYKGDVAPEERDLSKDTLAEALRGNIKVQIHCYRADEMVQMIDMAKEFDYKISAFHHAVESYKIADVLAKENICSAMWADWWGFKLEAYDAIQENIPMVNAAKACAVVHSDSPEGIQRLNQEAAKAMGRGNKMGYDIKPEDAVAWITMNPAKAIGVDKVTGSIEKGKNADLVMWNQNPFSVYAKAEKVWIDGAKVFDRADKKYQPTSDFELGNTYAK